MQAEDPLSKRANYEMKINLNNINQILLKTSEKIKSERTKTN